MREWTDAQKDAHIHKIEQRDQQLDLDALEKLSAEGLEDWELRALIQRLREVESTITESRIPWRLAKAEDRIAQLERVREAAQGLANAVAGDEPKGLFIETLPSGEEPAKL